MKGRREALRAAGPAATVLLAPAQITSYAKLRGYDAPGDSEPVHHGRAY